MNKKNYVAAMLAVAELFMYPTHTDSECINVAESYGLSEGEAMELVKDLGEGKAAADADMGRRLSFKGGLLWKSWRY